MKNVRFSQLVEKCGHPEVHLLLTKPEQDAVFQKALKSHRVMTVQRNQGSADHGVVGFEPSNLSQIFIFPKPLQSFADAKVVGINYDLLSEGEATTRSDSTEDEPRSRKSEPSHPPQKQQTNSGPESTGKVVNFPKAKAQKEPSVTPAAKKSNAVPRADETKTEATLAPPSSTPEGPQIEAMRKAVGRALKALQQGKQVVAYQILEGIVKDPK